MLPDPGDDPAADDVLLWRAPTACRGARVAC